MLSITYILGPIEWISTVGVTFVLIFLAEIGDKSQLVCMTLAARYRALPVLIGATLAFAFLNLLAVLLGTTVAKWLPKDMINIEVAVLFAGFGIHILLARKKDGDQEISKGGNRSISVTTFLLIIMAELGDKTQIAVHPHSLAVPNKRHIFFDLGCFCIEQGILTHRNCQRRSR